MSEPKWSKDPIRNNFLVLVVQEPLDQGGLSDGYPRARVIRPYLSEIRKPQVLRSRRARG